MGAPRRQWIKTAAASLIVAAIIITPLFLVPIPYFIFGPGSAVNLNDVIRVPKHSPPPNPIYLTDVRVFPGRAAYFAIARALPGFEIVPRSRVAAPNENDTQLNKRLVDAMRESQLTAEVVAESAAGYKVSARHSFVVERRLPKSPGAKCFKLGDSIVAINGLPPAHPDALTREAQSRPPGTKFDLSVLRGGRRITVTCATALIGGKPRFGIGVEVKTDTYRLPVRVAFDTKGINGSSAGLMFALQIYRTLTGKMLGNGRAIAGTGVLRFDGTVTAIEGTNEKLEAARRAGAAIFLMPKENVREIRSDQGIRVVPVSSFSQAVKSLQSLSRPAPWPI